MLESEKEVIPKLTVSYLGINPKPKFVTVDAKASSRLDDIIIANGAMNSRLTLSPSFRLYDFPPPEPPRKPFTFRLVRVATLLPLAFMVIVFGVLPLLRSLLDFSLQNLPLIAVQALVALTITILGVGLYVMRCRKQMMYGVCECLIGIATAGYFINNLKPEDPAPWFSMLAALYIIVRGVDNVHKSLKGMTVEERWNKIFFGKHPLPS